ncbi:uncharacterized protein ACNLHF_018486 isoform 1-T1 [Anomaloglossus baeobatrachus]
MEMCILFKYLTYLLFSVLFTAHSHNTMNFKAREEAWLCQINDMLKGDSTLVLDTSGTGAKEYFNKMKELLRKKTRTWWNCTFLQRYVEMGLIPRGLRVQVFPSFVVDNEVFKNRWENAATTCSRQFLELLIDLDKESLKTLEVEIIELYNNMEKNLTPAALKKCNEDLDTEVDIWGKEIQGRKIQKLQRDLEDKQSNKMYRWRNKKERSHPYYRPGFNRSRSGSMTSCTSGEETATGGNGSMPMRGNHETGRINWNNRLRPSKNKNQAQTKNKTGGELQDL